MRLLRNYTVVFILLSLLPVMIAQDLEPPPIIFPAVAAEQSLFRSIQSELQHELEKLDRNGSPPSPLRKAQLEVVILNRELKRIRSMTDADLNLHLSSRDEFEKTSEYEARRKAHALQKSLRIDALSAPLIKRKKSLEDGRYPIQGRQLKFVSYDADAEMVTLSTPDGIMYKTMMEPSSAKTLKANIAQARILLPFSVFGEDRQRISVEIGPDGTMQELVRFSETKCSGVKVPPSILSKVEPEGSAEWLKSDIREVQVVILLDILESGVPANMLVIKGGRMGLDTNALRAVSQWTFRPARCDGKAIPWAETVKFNFRKLH